MEFILELVRASGASVAVLVLGRWIFNSLIKRMEALETTSTKTLEAINACKISNIKDLVDKNDCTKDRDDLKKWVARVEDKMVG